MSEYYPPAAKPAKPKTVPLLIAALVVVVALVAFVAGRAVGIEAGEARAMERQATEQAEAEAAAEDARATIFVDALESCDISPRLSYVQLGDDNTTLDLDQKGNEDAEGLSIMEYWCILNALDVPDRVRSDMQNTTSMDGRREASWDGITASWSYHPSRGIDTVLYLD